MADPVLAFQLPDIDFLLQKSGLCNEMLADTICGWVVNIDEGSIWYNRSTHDHSALLDLIHQFVIQK